MIGPHRAVAAAYIASQGHLRGDCRGPKTLTQMAKEIDTSKATVRRWLRRDHWPLWMEYWASVEDIGKRRDRSGSGCCSENLRQRSRLKSSSATP